jgi:large subunit ribosomal protein L34
VDKNLTPNPSPWQGEGGQRPGEVSLIYSRGYCMLSYMSQTYQPKKRKRARAHGFLSRSRVKTGQKLIQRRRRKGRAKLSV